ncbi:hypothetical protein BO82DRAFT_369592 [Aspergillus uvarum CBS 121591]|uniref:Uncharacterized protein n=1 Tax=Aspergillus uvarum CBS 121591 TaxID=1448315 RepID=A0A319CC50_9EURO|nr:hypothetical protein BO82DRAFT_369592 [Aspergillus uvarum CBS 121591]PYH76183.1 hypothetical protein BO82DRAFT_369592 [Aspergillus uvarum CBS 121591]
MGNSPPKLVFLPPIKSLINFAGPVAEAPSVNALREVLKEIKSTLQTQANQQLQIANTGSALSTKPAASPGRMPGKSNGIAVAVRLMCEEFSHAHIFTCFSTSEDSKRGNSFHENSTAR